MSDKTKSPKSLTARNRLALALTSRVHPNVAKKLRGTAGMTDIPYESGVLPGVRGPSGVTFLMNASRRGDLTEVNKLLVNIKAHDINLQDDEGKTALFHAIEGATPNSFNIVKALIHGRPDRPEHLRHRDPGADVNLATHYPNGKSPLWVACDRGDLKIVNALIAAGANVNDANADGESPLWVASLEGRLNVVKALVAAGANVNALDSHNIGPLLCAASDGHLEIVKILLKEGADVNAADAFGQTPLSLATRYHHPDVVRLIDNHIDSLVRSAPLKATRSRSRSRTSGQSRRRLRRSI